MAAVGLDIFSGTTKNSMRVDPWIYLAEKHRTVFLRGPITDNTPAVVGGMAVPGMSCSAVIDLLLAFDRDNEQKPIKLFIDSPGGEVNLGLMLYDVMQSIRAPVYTIGMSCASMAAILLSAGRDGHRYAFPHCALMLHMGWGNAQGRGQERKKREKWLDKCDQKLAEIIIKHCKKEGYTAQQILDEWDEERELWMYAEDAREYGLIDHVITPEIYQMIFSS